MIPRLYTAALQLFPPAFRGTFGECMQADFADGLRDARRATARGAFAGWLARVAWDLTRSIAWQWLRTGVPWLTTAYAVAICFVCEGLSTIVLRSRLWSDPVVNPASGWWFAATVTTVVLVSGLTFVLWFVVPNLRRDTPVSIRA